MLANLDVDVGAFRSKGLIKDIQGSPYLTVAGRVALAHQSEQLAGLELRRVNEGDPDWIEFEATVIVINPNAAEMLTRLVDAMSANTELPSDVIRGVVFHRYQGRAKSAAEGSEAWLALKTASGSRRLPAEVTNPTEVAATSAVGRALGAAGFGEAESFASAEEVTIANARRQVSAPVDSNAPSDTAKKALFALAKKKIPNVTDSISFNAYVQETLKKDAKDLTAAEARTMTDSLKNLPDPALGDVVAEAANFA